MHELFDRRKTLRFVGSATMLPLLSRNAIAETYPTRPVRVIVPFGPGGPTDVFMRIVTQKLGERVGRQFYLENKPGAAGNVGTGEVARAAPDGFTMLATTDAYVINPTLFAKLPYDPNKDLKPVMLAVTFPEAIAITPSVPAKTLKELVDLIRANPGKYSFATPGNGTQGHLVGEMFRLSLGLDLVPIPFGGAGPAVASVVAGHTPIYVGSAAPTVPQAEDGKLRVLAVTGATRAAALPEAPTTAEAGYPGISGEAWIGILVPAGTPDDIVALLHREIASILRVPEMKERLATLGLDVVASTPGDFAKRIGFEVEKWGKLIRAANLKVE
jgi:tripartite-type tricarboxylate transporter receptor subunit TctC